MVIMDSNDSSIPDRQTRTRVALIPSLRSAQ